MLVKLSLCVIKKKVGGIQGTPAFAGVNYVLAGFNSNFDYCRVVVVVLQYLYP